MKYWCYDLTKFILWVFFRVRFGLEVSGTEHIPKHGAFIVASNHVSFLDPPVVGTACPRRLCFMARADLYQQPTLATFLRAVRAISVARGESDPRAIREAVRRLRQGEALAIFPEGGRQRSGLLGRAKRGVGLLAMTARVPIVPAVVRGTFQALPPEAQRLHRAKIQVAFGPQIPYTNCSLSSPVHPSTQRMEQGRAVRAARIQQEELADAVSRQWQRLVEQFHHNG